MWTIKIDFSGTDDKNREGWTHEDLISLLHINPSEMKDDGGRLVLGWIMKKDKPERKIAANLAKGIVEKTLPAKMDRTEFMKQLMEMGLQSKIIVKLFGLKLQVM